MLYTDCDIFIQIFEWVINCRLQIYFSFIIIHIFNKYMILKYCVCLLQLADRPMFTQF